MRNINFNVIAYMYMYMQLNIEPDLLVLHVNASTLQCVYNFIMGYYWLTVG